MTKATGRVRQERKLVQMEGHAEATVPEECQASINQVVQATWSPMAGWEAQVVIRQGQAQRSGRLVGFAVMLQLRPEAIEGPWLDVVRVDNSHGPVHIHRFTRTGSAEKRYEDIPTDCREELDDAIRWAASYVWDLEGRCAEWSQVSIAEEPSSERTSHNS